jgi:hypothetical protein
MPNPVVHFEIVGRDGKKVQEFYSKIFDWKVDANNPMSYGIVNNDGHGINGGLSGGDGQSAHAIFYIAVSDTDEYLKKVEAAGGKTVMPTETIPGMVTFAMFSDPDGNVVGLIKDEEPAH